MQPGSLTLATRNKSRHAHRLRAPVYLHMCTWIFALDASEETSLADDASKVQDRYRILACSLEVIWSVLMPSWHMFLRQEAEDIPAVVVEAHCKQDEVEYLQSRVGGLVAAILPSLYGFSISRTSCALQ